jgi:hypothetical protein
VRSKCRAISGFFDGGTRGRSNWPLRLYGIAALALLFALLPSEATAQPLTTGFNAGPAFTGGTAASRSTWDSRARSEGAGMIRLNLVWAQVASAQVPSNFSPSDPSSPGYNWTPVDAAIRGLSGSGVQVLLNVAFAPRWAEGAARPASAPPGTWRPDPTAYAEFAVAAATRYSGHFPDPLRPGAYLPKIKYWQAWNEPNVPNDLNPQWIRSGDHWVAESPIIYRQLLNAFYGAVKSVSASNFVVTAGTAPYGDPPGVGRVRPVRFDRDLFCLRRAKLAPVRCPDPPHLDALSHHPYGISTPLWHAFNHDDAAPADMYRIADVLKAAERWHHVLPSGPKRLWVTETSWDSNPPDPNGVPLNLQAQFVEQTMFVLWSQGVDTILWFQIADSPPIPNYGSTVQGGMYYMTGNPKPAAVAFRFPFVTKRLSHDRVLAWGRAPKGGRLTIEALMAGHWKVIRALRLKGWQVFQARLPIRGRATLRAQMRGETSLAWRQAS